MIIHDVEQLSAEWFALHQGIPTATDADKILTPTGNLSKQSNALINRLLAERAGYGDEQMEPTDWMLRGIELEEEARKFFQFDRDLKVLKVGFVTNDEGTAGCSPDGMIFTGPDDVRTHALGPHNMIGWEGKCPKASTHFGYLRSGELPLTYKPQTHWSLAVTGLDKWYFQSYFPGLDPLIILVERDEYTERVEAAKNEFLEQLAYEAAKFGLDYVEKRKAA